MATGSYDASTSGLVPGDLVFLDLGAPNEECAEVLAIDPADRTFDAVVAKDHAAGTTIRRCVWPTPILYAGNGLPFDIGAVASPDSGSDLTVVIRT